MEKQLAQLNLNKYRLRLHLGWPEAERQAVQPVDITIKLRFAKLPNACSTDQLDDTVCYDGLLSAVKAHCEAKHYRLIEYLAQDIYQLVQTQTVKADILIQVHKIQVPVEGLSDGAVMQYGDWRE